MRLSDVAAQNLNEALQSGTARRACAAVSDLAAQLLKRESVLRTVRLLFFDPLRSTSLPFRGALVVYFELEPSGSQESASGSQESASKLKQVCAESTKKC